MNIKAYWPKITKEWWPTIEPPAWVEDTMAGYQRRQKPLGFLFIASLLAQVIWCDEVTCDIINTLFWIFRIIWDQVATILQKTYEKCKFLKNLENFRKIIWIWLSGNIDGGKIRKLLQFPISSCSVISLEKAGSQTVCFIDVVNPHHW